MTRSINLPYGEESLSVSAPEEAVIDELAAPLFSTDSSEEELVEKALSEPINSRPLRQLVSEGDEVCIITGDVTRLWVRHHVFMPHLLEELQAGGVELEDIFVVSATGDHREQTPQEHAKIVGDEVYAEIDVFDHQGRNDEELVYLGHTPLDTPVHLNRRVAAADKIVLTGGIVHHFLAGFGGGGKAILPGVSGYETIMKNHSLALADKVGEGINPDVAAGKKEGNPCYKDIVAGAQMVRPTFLINTIVDSSQHRIIDVVAGEMLPAHDQGCRKVDKIFGVSINSRSELVLASCGGYPKDINLYQTYKTIYNARQAVQSGGTMLIVSECCEGMGNDDFASMLLTYSDSEKREKALRDSFTIGGYMALHLTLMAQEYDILLVSDLPEGTLQETGIKSYSSVESAWKDIVEKFGEVPPFYLMPTGEAFPRVSSEQQQ